MLERIARRNPPVYGPAAPSKLSLMGIRFATDGGDGTGAGGGDGTGSDGGNAGDADGDGLGDKGQQALDRMKTTVKTTRAELKAFADLGLTPEEIKALVDEKNAGNAPDEAAIRKQAQKEADTAAAEKFHGKLRASSVREQAATLNFTSPADALALIPAADLADVDVTDDEVDAAAVKKLLEKLATEKPYLLKPTDTTPGHVAAGIGGTGSGAKPEVQPGLPRMRDAYANSSKK